MRFSASRIEHKVHAYKVGFTMSGERFSIPETKNENKQHCKSYRICMLVEFNTRNSVTAYGPSLKQLQGQCIL